MGKNGGGWSLREIVSGDSLIDWELTEKPSTFTVFGSILNKRSLRNQRDCGEFPKA